MDLVTHPNDSRRRRHVLFAILAVGLALRLGVAVGFGNGGPVIADEKHYHALAVNLVETGTLADTNGRPTSLRPPLYPAFLAAIYAVFGTSQFFAVRVIQSLLGIATAWPLYLLARRMFDPKVAMVTVGIFCLYPSLIVMTGLLLAETVFTLFLILVALSCQRLLNTTSWRTAVMLGVWLALGALSRSVLWLFPPFLAIFLVIALRHVRWPRRILLAVMPAILFALVLTPWSVRNTRLEQTFVAVDTMGGRNFMMGNYEHTPMFRAWDTVTMRSGTDQAWDRILAEEYLARSERSPAFVNGSSRNGDSDPDRRREVHGRSKKPGFYDLTQGQRDKLAMRRGLTFAVRHPWLTIRRCGVKFFDFWQLDRAFVAGLAKGLWGPVSRPALIGAAVILCGSYAATVLGAIVGFVIARPTDRRMHVFLFLVVAFVCAIHTAVFGHARYHLTLMPLLSIYTAVAFTSSATAWRGRPRWAWLAAGSLCTLLVLSWILRAVWLDAGRGLG